MASPAMVWAWVRVSSFTAWRMVEVEIEPRVPIRDLTRCVPLRPVSSIMCWTVGEACERFIGEELLMSRSVSSTRTFFSRIANKLSCKKKEMRK